MKNCLIFAILILPFLGFSQNEYFEYFTKNYPPNKQFTNAYYENQSLKYYEFSKKLTNNYKLAIEETENGYFKLSKNGKMVISDSLGNVLNLPYNYDKNNYGITLYPTKKGTIFIPKKWKEYPELKTSYNIEIYDLNGKLIKKIDDGVLYTASGLGTSDLQFITKHGDFFSIYKDNKIGLLDEMGNVFLEPIYSHINFYGEKFLFLKNENGVVIYDLIKKQIINNVMLQEVKIHDIISNFTSNKIIAKYNNKFGLFNLETMEWLIPNQYDDLNYLYSNNIRIKDRAKDIDIIYSNRFVVTNNSLKGIVDINNSILIPIKYLNIVGKDSFDNNNFLVEILDSKYNFYNILTKSESEKK